MVNLANCTKNLFYSLFVHIIHTFSPQLLKRYTHPGLSILREKAVIHQLIHIIHNFLLFINVIPHLKFNICIFVYFS